MKNLKNSTSIFLLLLFSATISKGQSPGLSCAASMSIAANGNTGAPSQSNSDGWFSFTAIRTGEQIQLKNLFN
jgi:hypothetical protein